MIIMGYLIIIVSVMSPSWRPYSLHSACSTLTFAARRFQKASEKKDRLIPLLGVLAAFVFAGQMVNFPVLPGMSGREVLNAVKALERPIPVVMFSIYHDDDEAFRDSLKALLESAGCVHALGQF